MAHFEDFLSNFPYPASYLASAHKDSSEGALGNKEKLSPTAYQSQLVSLGQSYSHCCKHLSLQLYTITSVGTWN